MRKRLPVLAAAALFAFRATGAEAACSLDGQPAGTATTYSPTVATRTVNITTAHPNDIIVLQVAANAETNNTYPFPAVTGISGGGLNWFPRIQQRAQVSSCWTGGLCYADIEEWYALAPSPLTAQTITIGMDSDLAYVSLNIEGVAGATGFDPNGSLPAIGFNFSGSASVAEVAGISTNDAPDLALYFCSTFGNINGCAFPPSPWTGINTVSQDNVFIGLINAAGTAYQNNLPLLSSVTFSLFSPATRTLWFDAVDVLTCTAGGAFPNVEINE